MLRNTIVVLLQVVVGEVKVASVPSDDGVTLELTLQPTGNPDANELKLCSYPENESVSCPAECDALSVRAARKVTKRMGFMV